MGGMEKKNRYLISFYVMVGKYVVLPQTEYSVIIQIILNHY